MSTGVMNQATVFAAQKLFGRRRQATHGQENKSVNYVSGFLSSQFLRLDLSSISYGVQALMENSCRGGS
jgi:hypothetical protein